MSDDVKFEKCNFNMELGANEHAIEAYVELAKAIQLNAQAVIAVSEMFKGYAPENVAAVYVGRVTEPWDVPDDKPNPDSPWRDENPDTAPGSEE